MNLTSLQDVPVPALVDAFNDAFQNYAVDVTMTPERLITMAATRSVRFDHSWAFEEDGEILAFILNGSRTIDGVLTAYDSGTGVRLRLQRQGLVQRLLLSVVENLGACGYGRYVLEVLGNNTGAIKTYERHGFEITRTLNCYVAERVTLDSDYPNVEVTPATLELIQALSPLQTHTPSWQNATESIVSMPDPCFVIVAEDERGPTCFAIVGKESGSIMQFGCRNDSGDKFGAVLGRAAALCGSPELRALNIDGDDPWSNELLRKNGFRLNISQYEMERPLGTA